MSMHKLALLTVIAGGSVIWALPAPSLGQDDPLHKVGSSLDGAAHELGAATQQKLDATDRAVRKTTDSVRKKLRVKPSEGPGSRRPRVTAGDPQAQPPLRGTNPHAQGSVAVVDLTPSAERPQPDSTDGPSGEEIIAGRARGEQQPDGSYRGHITILSLFGRELAGVNTTPGETKNGPLQPIQQGLLDPICTGSGGQVCLSILTANSATSTSGSTNDFAVARARLGGLNVGAAESHGAIAGDANCQTSAGTSRAANVALSGGQIAGVTSASSTSRACRGQAPQDSRSSSVVSLGGTGIGLPAAGCADGTPDTRFQTLAPVATIICNADEQAGSGTRQALDVFALSAGGTSLVQESTAQAESRAVAPAGGESGGPACSDGADNDGDGVIDAADPGCHNDGNPNNPASYNPNDTSEADSGAGNAGSGNSGNGRPACSDGRDNDGDGVADARDPGCHTDGNANNPSSFDRDDDNEGNRNRGVAGAGAGGGGAECSDGTDNDGDGVADARDPGCHSDGNANNPASYNPNDDSEANGGGNIASGSLAFTGTDVLGLAISGLLLLAGGLALRRREGLLPRR